MKKPLVSLTVICYRAEKFIREAVEGALSQTYSPLEIIFSDDASPDATFSIIEEMVKDYKGPHKIVLNRNDTNIGIGAHVSKVWFDIAKGDWIIVSAGDDVSLPHRVERLMEVATPEMGAIHHRSIPIDESSNHLPYLPEYAPNHEVFKTKSVDELISKGQWLKGATMCLNRSMLLMFGKFNPDLVNEDQVLAYRAQAFGEILYLEEDLMLYRFHTNSVSFAFYGNGYKNYEGQVKTIAKRRLATINQVFTDSRSIKISESVLASLRSEMKKLEHILVSYGMHPFSAKMLFEPDFYSAILKRILRKPYWHILKTFKRYG